MPLRVLFVADDLNLQRSIRQMFDPLQRDWEVRVSRGGSEAMANLEEPTFDAFVTDCRLIGTDCTELLTQTAVTSAPEPSGWRSCEMGSSVEHRVVVIRVPLSLLTRCWGQYDEARTAVRR